MSDTLNSSSAKARRRILSCTQCRRLKSRCEFDSHLDSCQRCHKLRIDCSLRGSRPIVGNASTVSGGAGLPATHDRLERVENSIATVQESVQKIWEFLQENKGTPASSPPAVSLGLRAQPARSYEATQQQAVTEFPPLLPPQDNMNRSAPIMVVRRFRPSRRRLYKQSGRDIIDQGILIEDLANKLVEEFIRRLGPIIQLKYAKNLTEAASIREASPLLYAVCCLQALRFFKGPDAVNSTDHRRLYEEVRKTLGQVILETPIPMEELYAILIMCTFEAAPSPVFEYIESWHLSGICAQQAITTIEFARIMANLSSGKHTSEDTTSLSLWNNICLVHLRFAVGTGKPITIPSQLLEHCAGILNHPQAAMEDGFVLAEIHLLAALHNTMTPLTLDDNGQCPGLAEWDSRWRHLLDLEAAIYLRFCREFAFLVLAVRAMVAFQSINRDPGVFEAYAYEHASFMAQAFLAMPKDVVQELPKFHHICVAYCCLVLSECREKGTTEYNKVFTTLSAVCDHYRLFSDEIPAVMNVALQKVGSYNAVEDAGPMSTIQASVNDESAGVLGSPEDSIQVHRESADNTADQGVELAWFPTVDDFFDTWMMDNDNEQFINDF